VYLRLAERIAEHDESRTPAPMSVSELHEWAAGWATELLKVETGEVGQYADGI
jgi:nitrogenase iron protein NifH